MQVTSLFPTVVSVLWVDQPPFDASLTAVSVPARTYRLEFGEESFRCRWFAAQDSSYRFFDVVEADVQIRPQSSHAQLVRYTPFR